MESRTLYSIVFGTTFRDGKMYVSRAPQRLFYLAIPVSVCQFITGDVRFTLVDI